MPCLHLLTDLEEAEEQERRERSAPAETGQCENETAETDSNVRNGKIAEGGPDLELRRRGDAASV